jgi:hypothetical protein
MTSAVTSSDRCSILEPMAFSSVHRLVLLLVATVTIQPFS